MPGSDLFERSPFSGLVSKIDLLRLQAVWIIRYQSGLQRKDNLST
jgi:hypothetical protein